MPLTYDDIVLRVGRLMVAFWEGEKNQTDRADKAEAELAALKKQLIPPNVLVEKPDAAV